ncbi:hypothetical protein ACFT7S_11345 [Streptomyces sp. NPDC057136]
MRPSAHSSWSRCGGDYAFTVASAHSLAVLYVGKLVSGKKKIK